jgi:NADH-quinone oxidoreductase subunit J
MSGMDAALFYGLALLAVGAAVLVVAQRNPVHSAFALIVTLCALSGIYGLLAAPFIAALQVIVYAGAIMVLFLFVLMLLSAGREEGPGRPRTLLMGAFGLCTVLGAQIAFAVGQTSRAAAPDFDGSTLEMARRLFSAPFIYPFLATSVLITAALVGAVVLSKKDLP